MQVVKVGKGIVLQLSAGVEAKEGKGRPAPVQSVIVNHRLGRGDVRKLARLAMELL